MQKFKTLVKLEEFKKKNSIPNPTFSEYKKIVKALSKRNIGLNLYASDFKLAKEKYLRGCIIVHRGHIEKYSSILLEKDSKHHRAVDDVNKEQHFKKCEKSSKLRNKYDKFLIEVLYVEDQSLINSQIPICFL